MHARYLVLIGIGFVTQPFLHSASQNGTAQPPKTGDMRSVREVRCLMCAGVGLADEPVLARRNRLIAMGPERLFPVFIKMLGSPRDRCEAGTVLAFVRQLARISHKP